MTAARNPPRSFRSPALLVCLALSVACPPDLKYYPAHTAQLPDDASSRALPLSVTLTATMPQGDWGLNLTSDSSWSVRTSSLSDGLAKSESPCTSDCTERAYGLDCPHGTCTLILELTAPATASPTLGRQLSANFRFSDSEGGRCAPNPNYVDQADRERLFDIKFEVHGFTSNDAGTVFPPVTSLDAGQVAMPADTGPIIRGRSTLVDTRDNRVYTTVILGTQEWMAQNLDVGTVRTGLGSAGIVYDDTQIEKFCPADNVVECTVLGGLYSWAEALGLPSVCNDALCATRLSAVQRGICPSGWHIPTHSEWSTLAFYLAQKQGDTTPDEALAWALDAELLRANTRWPFSVLASDESGFAALPVQQVGDARAAGGTSQATWFQSTEEGGLDASGSLIVTELDASWNSGGKPVPASVRCVRDP